MEKTHKKFLVESCRYLLGAVFVFSGFVKAIDPIGGGYKIAEYLNAFGLSSLSVISVGLSVIQSSFEFLLGVCLLLGVYRRNCAIATLAVMLVMTPLTLYLAVSNPVTDCGCFGDALTLTNWETFIKNLVLLAASVYLFLKFRWTTRLFSHGLNLSIITWTTVFILSLTYFCYSYLPIVDFRPYKIGTNISQGMIIPEGAEPPEYETRLIYAKNGFKKEFSINDYPKDDPSWTFVDSRSRLISEGYVPKIHDFSITNSDNEDITRHVLDNPSYTFLLISTRIEDARDNEIWSINDLYDYSVMYGYEFYALTASLPGEISVWKDITGADYPFCTTDETTLKTIIRSNPGLLLLKNGVIINKWSAKNLPVGCIGEPLEQSSYGKQASNYGTLKVLLALVIFVLPIIVLMGFDKFYYKPHRSERRQQRRRRLRLIQQFIRNTSKHLKNNRKMRKKIVAGNWKMNNTLQEGVQLATDLQKAVEGKSLKCDVVICTPFIHLAPVAAIVKTIGLGAENCADKVSGAYTGEVSAAMIASTGAKYVIIGHSERRTYYGETNATLKEKTLLALANSLTPIFCVGEVLDQREAGQQNEVVGTQIAESLFDLSAEDFGKIVLAYEPVWAIGTGKTATAAQAQEMHAFIRKTVEAKYGKTVADNTSILYGGSCNASNAAELFANPDVDGGLIGGASLSVDKFLPIAEAF